MTELEWHHLEEESQPFIVCKDGNTPLTREWFKLLGPLHLTQKRCAKCKKFISKTDAYITIHLAWMLHISCFTKILKQALKDESSLLGALI